MVFSRKIVRHHFSSVDSTNNWARKHIETFDKEALTIISADQQTAGRGQFQRKWHSPPCENLYLTFTFFMEKEYTKVTKIPQFLAHCLTTICEQWGINAHVKFPNDVLIEEKKVAGILCETIPLKGKLAVICGIGVNVNMPLEECLKVPTPTTSLALTRGKPIDCQQLIRELEKNFFPILETSD